MVLRLFLKLIYPFQHHISKLFCNDFVYMPFAVGYGVIPYMGKLCFCAYYFLNLINVLDVDKVKAAAHIGYFYKNWIHAPKVVILGRIIGVGGFK